MIREALFYVLNTSISDIDRTLVFGFALPLTIMLVIFSLFAGWCIYTDD